MLRAIFALATPYGIVTEEDQVDPLSSVVDHGARSEAVVEFGYVFPLPAILRRSVLGNMRTRYFLLPRRS